MACGACAKKAAARAAAANQQVALPATITPVQPIVNAEPRPEIDSNPLIQKRYIGPQQRLESANQMLTYGVRNPGEVLLIFQADYEAHPEWWADV